MANFLAAKKLNMHILPVINKIDMMNMPLEEMHDEIERTLNIRSKIGISAKTGKNMDLLIKEIIENFPPPIDEPIAFD